MHYTPQPSLYFQPGAPGMGWWHGDDLLSMLADSLTKLWYKSSVTESNSVNLAIILFVYQRNVMPKRIMLDTFMGHNFDYL